MTKKSRFSFWDASDTKDWTEAWLFKWRRAYLNRYHSTKWNQQSEFKSKMRLFMFHFTLMFLEKTRIYLFSFLLYVYKRADKVLKPWFGNQSWKRKILDLTLLKDLPCVTSCLLWTTWINTNSLSVIRWCSRGNKNGNGLFFQSKRS